MTLVSARSVVRFLVRFLLVAGALGIAVPFARAADGVIEINQAKVTAAGGFPYTINASGSYKLTSNLTQASSNPTTFIVILADNVTLDLNGFSITGGNTCTVSGSFPNRTISCTTEGGGSGVSSPNRGISVFNGNISGTGGACLNLGGGDNRVERVFATHCGGFGIAVGGGHVSGVSVSYCKSSGVNIPTGVVDQATVKYAGGIGVLATRAHRVTAEDSLGGFGINAYQVDQSLASFTQGVGVQGNLVGDSRSNNNSGDGINLSNGVTRNSFATGNGGAGIYASSQATVIGNTATGNAGSGIHFANSGTAIGNTSYANNGYGIRCASGFAAASQNFLGANTLGDTGVGVVSVPANSNVCFPFPC